MKNIFLDTNVVIDYLADRRPFSIEALQIFNHCISGKCKLYISPISYNNIYYIVREKISHAETIELLSYLTDIVEIRDMSRFIIEQSLKSDFKDFEDAIQYQCALSNPLIDAVVTRNEKDFKRSTLAILTPKELLGRIGV